MKKYTVLSNCIIADSEKIIENGEVIISDGKISSVRSLSDTENPGTDVKDEEILETINLGGRLLIPGMVNPHTHLYSSLSAGLAPLGSCSGFTDVLEKFWWPLDRTLDEETVYCSAISGMLDAISHGVTCIFDHHASMNCVRGSLSAIESAVRTSGLKSVLCFESSDRGPSKLKEHIDENLGFIESHTDDALVKGMFGLHANFTLSSDSMKTISSSIKESGFDVPVHIHIGEDRADLDFCKADGFAGPVHRLEAFGLLAWDSILAHCIHLSDSDRQLLEVTRPFIISNPESNANNRVGFPELDSLPGFIIGTDGMSFDMISSLRAQHLFHRFPGGSLEPLESAFFQGQRRLLERFFPTVGLIAPGFDADIAVSDYVPVNPVNRKNIAAHLIYGAKGGRVYMTISSGNILFRNGGFTFIFAEALNERIRKAASAVYRRYYG